VNRADRRLTARQEKAHRWGNLARDFRGMADNPILSLDDRAALRRAAAQLDAGRKPLLVLARISGTLARIETMTKEGDL
jgi:hypothetical protein